MRAGAGGRHVANERGAFLTGPRFEALFRPVRAIEPEPESPSARTADDLEWRRTSEFIPGQGMVVSWVLQMSAEHASTYSDLVEVVCLRDISIGYGTEVTEYAPGEIVDLTVEEAASWCRAGWARPL